MRKYNPPRLFGGSKRYRKKWHLGEFSVYCFSVETGKAKEGYDSFQYMDDFIRLVESLNLECGGGMSPNGMDMTVSGINFRNNPNKSDANIIKEWVEKRFNDVKIGPFENAWYPNLPCSYEG
jgi:uncharacterized protein YggL (DUF469 family)